MVQIVKLENGEVHEFPDDATEQEINSSLNSMENNNENGAVKKAVIDKFNYLTGINRTPVDTLRDLGSGIISGLGKGGQFIASALTGGYAPTVDWNNIENKLSSPKKSISGEIEKGIGSYLPYGIAGGPSLIGQLAAGGSSGIANTEPGESNLFGILPSGKTGGAIEGALLNALSHGALKGFEALRPSKMFRGNLSPEELQSNLDITQGTETGLGDVIQSPYLKRRLENTLTNIPFSGANESLQRTGNLVLDRGNSLLKRMLGNNDPSNVPKIIYDRLNHQFKLHQDYKNSLYDEVNNIADNSGLKLELPRFSRKAKNYIDAIDSTNILKFEPDIKSIFEKLKNYKNPVRQIDETGKIVDLSGNPIITGTESIYPSLKEANILKGRLNHYAQMSSRSPDPSQRALSKVFSDLSSSLKEDINSSINESGDYNLKSAYEKAESNYKENFSPFLDKEIYKYIGGNKDPETIISNFIRTSPASDLAGHLGKLSSKLSDPSKRLLGYSYFSRALDNEGNLNPAKFGTLYHKLGKNQLKVLIPDKQMRNAIRDYVKLQGMNKEAQYLMFNPKTGQRNTDALITGLMALGGHLATGNIKGAATAIAAPLLAGRYTTKALTSPEFRENLVKAMIENKSWDPRILQATQSVIQGIVNR